MKYKLYYLNVMDFLPFCMCMPLQKKNKNQKLLIALLFANSSTQRIRL